MDAEGRAADRQCTKRGGWTHPTHPRVPNRSGTRPGQTHHHIRSRAPPGCARPWDARRPEAWRYDAIPFSAIRSTGATCVLSRKRLGIKSGLIMPPLRLVAPGPHDHLYYGSMACGGTGHTGWKDLAVGIGLRAGTVVYQLQPQPPPCPPPILVVSVQD